MSNDKKRTREDVASSLVELAQEHFIFAKSLDGKRMAIPMNGANVGIPLDKQDTFANWLSGTWHQRTGKVASNRFVIDAVSVCTFLADSSPPLEFPTRLTVHGRDILIDRGDQVGLTYRVNAQGWEILDRSPIPFRRSNLIGPLPLPEKGGSLTSLRAIANVDDEQWPILVAWLVSCMLPEIAHPVLWLTGEHGTGKTTLMSLISRLIDASPASVRSAPTDRKEWALMSAASWCCPLDNISQIPAWFSDALCKAVTGDAHVARELFSDSTINVQSFRRVIVLNGIQADALRGDLADRAVPLPLSRISRSDREDETEIKNIINRDSGLWLGALYDLTVEVLQQYDTIIVSEAPRMAAFYKVLNIIDGLFGLEGRSLKTFAKGELMLSQEVVESDAFAFALYELVTERTDNGKWRGKASDLLQVLDRPDNTPFHEWPSTPHQAGMTIRRVSPALKQLGITAESKKSNGSMMWYFAIESSSYSETLL